jgi:hypothetical protein
MAVADESDNTPLPGTVFTPRQVRMLKIAVIVMGILLVGGFAFVMAAIVYQASKLGEKDGEMPAAAAPQGAGAIKGAGAIIGAEAVRGVLALPPDATVTSMALDGDRLALHLQSSAGAEIAVIDVTSGKVLSRIKVSGQ